MGNACKKYCSQESEIVQESNVALNDKQLNNE